MVQDREVIAGAAATGGCRHCGAALEPGAPAPFCCHGCRAAHDLIQACGLADFHRLREGQAPLRPEVDAEDWVDGEGFRQRHEHDLGDGRRLIRWRVAGVHCAACVWLLERLPRLDPGICSARLDLSMLALDLVVREDCPPSRQRALVAGLGYRLLPWRPGDLRAVARSERRARVLRLAVASASALGAMHLALPLVAGDLTGDLDPATRIWYGWAAVLVALPGLTWAARPFWQALALSLRLRRLSVDAIAGGVIALALGAGVVSLLRGGGELYVDAAAMFVALLLGARLVLETLRERVARGIGHLPGLFGESAQRIDDRGAVTRIAIEDVVEGDRLRVAAGAIIPADGTVERAADAQLSVAVITGESRGVRVVNGDRIWAGSRCLAGGLDLRVTAVGPSTRVGRLIQGARAGERRERGMTDRLLAWFVPVALALALVVGLVWWWYEPARAFEQVLAVLLAACPCAISLAAPLAGAAALAQALRRGILIRDPEALLRCAKVDTVVFDKTGTLTRGRPELRAWTVTEGAAADLPWVVALARRSTHPLAATLAAEATRRGVVAVADDLEVREVPGQGVEARTPLGCLRLGRAAFVGVAEETDGGGSRIHAAVDGRLLLSVDAGDDLAEGAGDVIAALPDLALHLASGDRAAAVGEVAGALGFPGQRIHADLDPEAKAALVRSLGGRVAMVGDGVNDAAAMGAASVGIAVRGGLAACIDRCDVVVGEGGLADVPAIFAAGRNLHASIRRCLVVSVVYHLAAIAAVLAGVIGPLVCAVAMPLSSLTVLGLALMRPVFSRSA